METETEHLLSLPPPPPSDHQQEEGVQETEALADAGAEAKAAGVSETAGDGACTELAAADSGAASAAAAAAAAAEGLLTDDLRDKIVRQVEYYFSDENLPTDKFLLKYVKRNKEWFVPIPVIASFRRMKRLVQDISLIEAALRTSSQLVVSEDGKKVTRLNPLPVAEVKHAKVDTKVDKKAHTVMVENLPDDYSTDNLQKIFGNVGKIVNIMVHDPHSTEESAITKKAEMTISNKLHALIEYETVEEAANAVATLNDEKNWRSGMRVEILLKWMGKYVYGRNRRGPKETLSEKNNNQSPETLSDVQKFKYDGLHDEKTEIEDDEHHAGGKGKRRGRYSKSQARGQQSANGQGHGHVPSGDTNVASKPLPGPKMPDGTRGFTMGRGKPATAQSDPPHV